MYLRRIRDLREDHDYKQEYVANILKETLIKLSAEVAPSDF